MGREQVRGRIIDTAAPVACGGGFSLALSLSTSLSFSLSFSLSILQFLSLSYFLSSLLSFSLAQRFIAGNKQITNRILCTSRRTLNYKDVCTVHPKRTHPPAQLPVCSLVLVPRSRWQQLVQVLIFSICATHRWQTDRLDLRFKSKQCEE